MLVLPSELTHQQATSCLGGLLKDLPAQGEVAVLDASALTRFDSSALAVLLEFRRAGLAQGKRVEIRGLASRLVDLAQLYGVAELLSSAA